MKHLRLREQIYSLRARQAAQKCEVDLPSKKLAEVHLQTSEREQTNRSLRIGFDKYVNITRLAKSISQYRTKKRSTHHSCLSAKFCDFRCVDM